jgi:prepilin-type N-terminal cleavage/methylation domain-containing protein
MRLALRPGFTLIEIILVVALIGILASVVIIAINPAKQFASTNNAKRRADINVISSAVNQYLIDHKSLPSTITPTSTEICVTGGSCAGLIDLSVLTNGQLYLTSIPIDPTTTSTNGTGYTIALSTAGRFWINAPLTQNGDIIAYGVAALPSGTMFGDTDASKVLTTASTPGTYDATNLATSTVKLGTAFGVGLTGAFYGDIDASKVCSTASAAGTLNVSSNSVGVGNTYCGVAGALLASEFNGTRSTNPATWPGGVQQFGGTEDFNANGASVGQAPPEDRYAKSWTACNVGNSYCGTGDSGSAYKDVSTGLVWSKTMNAVTYALDDSNGTLVWLTANNCNEVAGNSCTKRVAGKIGCEANTGWYLPHQKQLMQAYLDGIYGILEPTGVAAGSVRTYWSSTTLSTNLANAWTTNLSTGSTGGAAKTGGQSIRCVR